MLMRAAADHLYVAGLMLQKGCSSCGLILQVSASVAPRAASSSSLML